MLKFDPEAMGGVQGTTSVLDVSSDKADRHLPEACAANKQKRKWIPQRVGMVAGWVGTIVGVADKQRQHSGAPPKGKKSPAFQARNPYLASLEGLATASQEGNLPSWLQPGCKGLYYNYGSLAPVPTCSFSDPSFLGTMGTTLFLPFGTNLCTSPTSLHSCQLVSYYPDLPKAAVNDLLEINPKVLKRLPPSCLNCILAFRKCDTASYSFQCMQCKELNKPGETCSFMRGEEELDIIRRDLFPEVTKGAFLTNMAISSTYAFEDCLRDFLVYLKEISDDLGVDGLKEQFTCWPNSDVDTSVALADWAVKSLAAYEDSQKARDIVTDRIHYACHTSEASSSPPPNISTLDKEPEATLKANTSAIGVETIAGATGEA
ncbi:hypothetical protein C8J57DRAFT_1235799 [Mycena rebaudengoi]|nr:hypothetical protein C8J57DRAFT_1235799 [Mycena rebaudengoi]